MIARTRDWFEAFVAAHRQGDPAQDAPLELKREHCLLVMDEAREQALELGLPDKQVELATVAGLCHDVGRFPQYLRYHTFRDRDSANHGLLGAVALSRHGGLAWLSPGDRHLVRLAVAVHNRLNLPPAIARRNGDDALGRLVHIVRDADKLDIARVMLEHFTRPGPKDPVVFLGLPDDPERYNPNLLRDVVSGRPARYEAMTTTNDFALLLLSWIHTMAFPRSRRVFFSRGLARDLLSQLPDTPAMRDFAAAYQDRYGPRSGTA